MTVYQRMQTVSYGVLALLQLLFMHWQPDQYQHLRFKVRSSCLLCMPMVGMQLRHATGSVLSVLSAW
jgi:hypothetical protein